MSEVSWGWIAMMMFMGTCTTAFLWQNATKIVKNLKSGTKKKNSKAVPDDFPDVVYFTQHGECFHYFPDCGTLRDHTGASRPLWDLRICRVCKAAASNMTRSVDHPGSIAQKSPRATARYGDGGLPESKRRCFLCSSQLHQQQDCPRHQGAPLIRRTDRAQRVPGGLE